MKHDGKISVAIETSCRLGAVALGIGDKMISSRMLGTSGRHAAELVACLDEMLREAAIKPGDVNELYVSVGPGSFTGLRVGITVARTWSQLTEGLRLFAVPTSLAVAYNYVNDDWRQMCVMLAAKEHTVHATLLTKDNGRISIIGKPVLLDPITAIETMPRPLTVAGEALGFCGETLKKLSAADGITIAAESHWLPEIFSLWHAGNELAATDGCLTDFEHLLPEYARRPEAVRLWEHKHLQLNGF
ncbi:MAG TPA: tRNA (adenosine(37)-N6)-threonylcarbamoyltransferase complex dimerization subunit type 1 TsaB [Phycisphaerae bacterium]|nr:tRNA (adenosine(37)-N6)-threonylcarbamoyltransferase complex dimerization subunit type 1 TsaB [Phycisphaerae bacterium]HPS53087.1 tRNA (adenosine(37)-N6)-threonylcarbamoyltransferase complex dimerization subunit type 1 TsaB [Phycisphaerae bacterium]